MRFHLPPLLKPNRSLLIFLPIFLCALSIVTWQLVKYGQQKTLEFQAIQIAEIIARQAASARSTFSKHVVVKLNKDGFGAHPQSKYKKGFVPLPAQFLKLFGQRASNESDGLFTYKLVSKWNLEPSQGLDDDFKRWAWSELEKQDLINPDMPIKWKPVWRFENIGGITTLRYQRADPASADSCVNCHNTYETSPEIIKRREMAGLETGKQWKLNQLLGAIQVNIPLQKIQLIAAKQANLTTAIIITIIGFGFVVITFLVVRDSLRSQKVSRDLVWQANHDDLTGLASRLAFVNRAEELLIRSRKDNSIHTLIIMDLDQFKIINDTCGHEAGDELLCKVAETLRIYIRNSDLLARLGGDEFGVIFESCDIENAYLSAEKIRKAIRGIRFTKGKRDFELGVSIGLVSITKDSKDVASLLSCADLACHTAKDEGRNRIQVYGGDKNTQIGLRQAEMEWASKFKRTMDEDRLRLAVQYARHLSDDKRPRYYSEILLRLIDDNGEFISPVDFISAAERYQFMITIDRWVINKVFEMITDKTLPLRPDEVIAINLSGLSVNDKDFLNYIKELFLTYSEVPSNQICFEITETAAIANLTNAQNFIKSLHNYGCQFSLDDFGSGLSSFTYLKNLPIDYLKIEGSFVLGMLTEPVDHVVVESVSLIGKRIKTAVIAECVENDEILKAIQSLGVDYAQGYGIHRPTVIELFHNQPKFEKKK